MATRSEARRQGHAGRVLAALIAWGTNLGAHTAWLQVEQSNLGARRLYDRAGFTVVYSYAYSAVPA